MAQPIDYTPLDPFAAGLSGLKFGMGLAEVEQRQMLQEQQKRAQEQYQQAFSRIQSPNATATDYENLILLSGKDQAENIRKVLEGRDARQNQNTLKQIGGVAFALKTGSPEQASMLLMRQAEAAQNSGDANEAQYLRQMAELAKTQPDNVGNLFASQMTFIPGGKEALDNLLKLTQEKRVEAKAPIELLKLKSEAIIKEQEAKFAPEVVLAGLNLTKEQINQAKAAAENSRAAAAKSGAEASRQAAEARQILSGLVPPEKRPELETKFRTEYNNQTKPYQEVKSAYGRVLSSEDTAVGDLSLIFGYMKMLDPGSVVREGEFATAQNAAGVPERIMNIYNKVATGQRLSPSQRESFKGQAKGLYNSALEGEKTVRTGLERISKGYGLNTENIFYSPTEQAPVGAPPASAENSVTVGGNTYNFPTKAAADAFKNSDAYRKAAGTR